MCCAAFCCSFFSFVQLYMERSPPDFDLPIGEASQSGSTLWLAMDAGQVCGSSVVELKKGLRVFLAFQADIVFSCGAVHLWERVLTGTITRQDIPLDGIRIEQVWATLCTFYSCRTRRSGARCNGFVQPRRASIRAVMIISIVLPGAMSTSRLIIRCRWMARWSFAGAKGEFGAKPRITRCCRACSAMKTTRAKPMALWRRMARGKFSDLSTPVLEGFRSDGFTHIWLTGIIQQATATDYGQAGPTIR